MKISRIDYDPGSALAFYEEALSAMGALCERTWHDRLEVVAEGRAASLWNDAGALHAQELLFAPADVTVAREDRIAMPRSRFPIRDDVKQ